MKESEARWRAVAGRSAAILLALLLAVGLSSPAAEEEPSRVGFGLLSSPAAEVKPSKFRFGLYVEYENFSYLSERGGVLVDYRNALTAIPKVDWTPSEGLLLHLSTLLRKDFSEESRSQVELYDGFVNLDREGWSLKAGRQFITWGRADSFRPTDVFKRYDFTDLIENREEATDTVKLDLFQGPWTLEGVWAPVFNPDTISYRPENRWNGLPPTTQVPGLALVNLSYRTAPTQPAAALGSGQVGVRLSGSAQGWDFAGMYYYGYDRVPTITRKEVAWFDPLARAALVTLVPIHKRIQVFGGDVATAISGWGLRGEASYTLTADLGPGISGNDPYFRFTGGVDRTFSRLPIGESLSIILQYALDTEPRQPGPINQQVVDPRLHPFQHALMVNNIWKYTEFIRLNAKGYVNLEQGDYVIQSEVSWQPIDSMTVVVGGDVLGGRANTFFGQFRHNDRVRFRVSYEF